jgi:hypothetical protein
VLKSVRLNFHYVWQIAHDSFKKDAPAAQADAQKESRGKL